MKHSQDPWKNNLTNTFGVLGYISVLLQWLWSSIIAAPTLIDQPLIQDIFLPSTDNLTKTTPQPSSQIPDQLMVMIGVVITVFVIVLSIYLLLKLPAAIAKNGNRAVLKVANTAVPVVLHRKKITVQERQKAVFKISVYIKLLISSVPLVVIIFLPFIKEPVDANIVIFISCISAIFSLSWFGIQYILATVFEIPSKKIL